MTFMPLTAKLKNAALWACLAVGATGALVFLGAAYLKFQYPYLLGLGEPALEEASRFLREGRWPYRELSSPPYFLVPYGPVFPSLTALASVVVKGHFLAGRAVCLLAALGCTGLLYRFLRQNAVRPVASAAAALLFLAHPYTRNWGTLVNVDITALCLELGTLVCLDAYVRSGYASKKAFGLGVVLSILAFFTKSSMIAAPAAFFLFALSDRRPKVAWSFLVLSAGGALACLWTLDALTGGAYSFHTVYEISKRLVFPEFFRRYWTDAVKMAPLFAAVSLWAMAQVRSRETRLFALYVITTVFLTVSLIKQGSDTNYLLEWCAASALAAGYWLGRFDREKDAGRMAAAALFAAAMAVQAVFFIKPAADLSLFKKNLGEMKSFYDNVSEKIIQKIDGPILSEDLSLLVVNGRELYYEPFPMGQMAYTKVWDQSVILKEIEEKKFKLALLYVYAPRVRGTRTFTPEFMEAFKAHYRLMGGLAPPVNRHLQATTLFIYAPKEDSA